MNPAAGVFPMTGQHYPPNLMLTAYAFVDGGYLRKEAEKLSTPFPNPHSTIEHIMSAVRNMGGYGRGVNSVFTRRLLFYDAVDPINGESDPNVQLYWSAIEQLNDTEVRCGTIRGRPGRQRQKGVDVLLAVDMLVGAHNRIFDVAVLVSGDEDFIPVVNEVKRGGVSVVVGGVLASTSVELRRVADRFIDLTNAGCIVKALDFPSKTTPASP